MMNVSGINASASGTSGHFPDRRERHNAPLPESPGRALVSLAAPPVPQPAANLRDAAFLAQLIASKERIAQTRARRRAEPNEAIAAYRAAAALTAKRG